MSDIRSPIVVVLAHVDHGKTTLLDTIRHTSVAKGEAGGITQLISTTKVPVENIVKACGELMSRFKITAKIPGLLFIDTPGHESFSAMRRRGGSIADIAVLLIDIMEGIMPQTKECIEILKSTKTPFVIAINKIDKIQGWEHKDMCFIKNFELQSDEVKGEFEKRFYEIIEDIKKFGFEADRFDRINDFRKKVVVVPISAVTGEGIPDLLMIIMGLAQHFLKDRLIKTENARGLVLEVKESKGLGFTIDVVIADGKIRKNDYIVIAGKDPCITKIRALLKPSPLKDIRSEKQFTNVDEVVAAAGIRIAAPCLDDVIAGNEFRAMLSEEEAKKVYEKFMEEKKSIEIKKEEEGLILRADTVGSLEALEHLFNKLSIKMASVEQIKKEAILDAAANTDPMFRVVIGFNVQATEEAKKLAKDNKIKIITSNIIYRLLEEYEIWKKEKIKSLEEEKIKDIPRPAKFRVLPGFVFRASDPAIVGCEVIGGILKPNTSVIKETKGDHIIGKIKELQKENKNIQEAKTGERLAVSITGPTVGRQLKEGDILFVDMSSQQYKILKEYEQLLTNSEKKVLEELVLIKRKTEKMWGV